jgi:hypothetical protein
MGVVLEVAREMSLLAQEELGPRSSRLAGYFTLTRLVGQINAADGRSWRIRTRLRDYGDSARNLLFVCTAESSS